MKKFGRLAVVLAVLPALLSPSLLQAEQGKAPERSYTISPNERIHVIQRKTDLLEGRFELTAYPITLQINSRWTEHLGMAVMGSLHLTETFAVQALLASNFLVARETPLQNELREKAQLQPPSAPSTLTRHYGILGFEMSPIYGKIAFYEGAMMSFNLIVSAGAGAVDTAVQLLGADSDRGRQVTAHAGLRAAGLVGAGFRVHLAEDWMIRVEVRDLIFSTRITRLNGCTADDLSVVAGTGGTVSESCRVDWFDPDYQAVDGQIAKSRADGSSDTINQISAYAGVSYLF